MGYLGYKPADKPLTAADITDSIITSAKITDATIVNGDIANSTIALAKLSATGTPSASNFLRGDNSWNTPAAGAYVFLGETSASNVASVSLNGYFTSSYDYYKIFIDGGYAASDNSSLKMKFATGGGYTVQSTNYYVHSIKRYQNGSAGLASQTLSNTTEILWEGSWSSTSTNASYDEITLFDPLGSNKKTFTIYGNQIAGNFGFRHLTLHAGFWNDTTAITGVEFSMNTGNIYARKIRIYGIKNS
jgi:hypothetical protein